MEENQTDLMRELKIKEDKIKELEEKLSETSHLLSEKNGMLNQTQLLVNEQKTALDKFNRMEKKFSRFLFHYIRKFIFRIAFRIFKLFETKPRMLKFLLKVNNKLGIFRNYSNILNSNLESNRAKLVHHEGDSIKNIKVAMIADEFTYNCFKYEFNALPITPTNWLDVFAKSKPDLFFCESAWSGEDPVRRPWKGKIYTSVRFKNENRAVLLQILKYCNKHNITTVFWNKEDPIHYMDKVHNFVDTAIKFDHIFTSAEECVELYKKDYGHKSVHALMFATQPKMFNPIEEFERTDEIVFAGSWYAQHPERCKEMGRILDNIIESGRPLKIYDRHSGTTDSNHFFPIRYRSYIHPKLEYEKLSLAYKGSKYALNINTSTESETMFARRVFELMSSNTCVLSNYSLGMEKLFGKNVFFVNDGINIVDEDKARAENLELVLSEHTYAKRFEQILKDIRFQHAMLPSLLTVFKMVTDEAQIEAAIHALQSIPYQNKKCVILLSQEIAPTQVKTIFQKYNASDVEIMAMDYLKKYDRDRSIFGNFIVLDQDSNGAFLKKAMLHVCYLEKQVGVIAGEQNYTFVKESGYYNTLFDASMFEAVFDEIKGKSSETSYKKYII